MSINSAKRHRRVNDPDGGFRDIVVWYCYLCDVEFESSHLLQEHLGTDGHAFRWCLDKFEKKRRSLIKERHGICIEISSESEYDYRRFQGVVETHVLPHQPVKFTVEVVNLMDGVGGGGGGGPAQQKGRHGMGGSGKRGPVFLRRIMSLVECPIIKDPMGVTLKRSSVELNQGSTYELMIEVPGLSVSTYRYPIVFMFQLKSTGEAFYIIRELVLNVSSGEKFAERSIPEASPFQGLEWGYVSGTYEALTKSGSVVRRIDEYGIPMAFVPMFASGLKAYEGMSSEALFILEKFMTLTKDGVSIDNYAEYYHMLLHHDEFEAQKKIEKFNMMSVSLMLAEDNNVELEVPGLEEKRPSVLVNDLVYLRLRNGDNPEDVDPLQYEGRVSRVNIKTIWIECGNGLPALVYPGARFDVRFGLNRFPLMVMHRSVDGMVDQDLLDYVFPDENLTPHVNPNRIPKLSFFNNKVQENPEQKQAVVNILMGSSTPAPYIVFGPPGTGKTITIVEAILQVVTVYKDSNILVCTPSNAACDLLAEMLLPYCGKDVIIRLHSQSRDLHSIPESLVQCSNVDGDKITKIDPHTLQKYRIICCTLISAGKLPMGILPRDHVTHVFIDECGQSVEPEAVAAVAGLLGFRAASMSDENNPQANGERDGVCQGMLVLAGDPLQLGPVCASEDASKIGLGVSLLERLMTRCSLYQREGESFNPLFITKLVRNFRSHPDILLLPNRLFYENELEAHSKAVLKDPLCQSSFPVHFHSVVGGDEREGSSPSYFNLREVEVIVGYLQILLDKRSPSRVKEQEVGILTPYTRQVYKLKQALHKKGWNNVEVGSTEVYQGREKRVMIISTVRSGKSALLVDGAYRMGFLSNPKRFNVAITRAQARLIVVGDPYVLCRNVNWMAVITLAQEHSTFVGAKFIPRDEAFLSRVHPTLDKVVKPS